MYQSLLFHVEVIPFQFHPHLWEHGVEQITQQSLALTLGKAGHVSHSLTCEAQISLSWLFRTAQFLSYANTQQQLTCGLFQTILP